MSSKQSFVDYILDQISHAGFVSAKKMFGEYAIFCDEKVVALVCDNQLFVKVTPAGKKFIGECLESPPYRGAKPWFLISEEKWDEEEWLTQLIQISAANLLLPPKKSRKKCK